MTRNGIPSIEIVRPTGSRRGKSSSRTSVPMTATKARRSFSGSVKKRPRSTSRFESSATFAVTPEIWTSERRRLPERTGRVVPERAPTMTEVRERRWNASKSLFWTRLRLSASRNPSRVVMMPKRSMV